MSAQKAAKVMAPKEGQILDRGYQPYTGRYTPDTGRWQSVASRTLRLAARQWWAILLMVAAVVPLLYGGIVMWTMSKLAAVAPPGVQITDPDHFAIVPWGTMTLAF